MYLWRKTGRDTVVTNAIWKLQRKYMSRSKKERKIMTFAFVGNDWIVLWLDDTYMTVYPQLLAHIE